VIVLSRQQDPVEIINSTLRNAGQAVHCTWVRELADLAEAMAAPATPQLLFFCLTDPEELASAMEQRSKIAARVPALIVRDALTEGDLVRGLELGAAIAAVRRQEPGRIDDPQIALAEFSGQPVGCDKRIHRCVSPESRFAAHFRQANRESQALRAAGG